MELRDAMRPTRIGDLIDDPRYAPIQRLSTVKTNRQLYIEMLERMLSSAERVDSMSEGKVRPKVWLRMIAETAKIRAKLATARADNDPNENPASVQLAGWMGGRLDG